MGNKKLINGLFCNIYIFSYISALISAFTRETLIDGNSLYVTGATENNLVNNVCNGFLLLSIIINLILFSFYTFNRHGKKTIFFLLLFVLYIINVIFNLSIIPIFCFLFYLLILNASIINNKLFIKIDFILKLLLITTIIIFYFLNIFPSNNIPTFVRNNGLIRSCLGFNNPNTLAGAILCLILSFVLCYGNFMNKFLLLIMVSSIGLYFFYLTDSRSLMFSILGLIFLLSLAHFKKIDAFLEKYTPYFLIGSLILSVLIVLYYKFSLPFSSILNHIMSDRLSYQLSAITNFHIYIYKGNELPIINNYSSPDIKNMTTIDNVFVALLIRCGVIGTLIYEYFFISSAFIAKKNHNYILSCVLIALSIQFFFEADYDKMYTIAPFIYAFSLKNRFGKSVQ